MSIEPTLLIPTAGDYHTIICSVITEDNLIVKPTLKWILTSNIANIFESEVNSSTLALVFNPLYTSHGGVYTCEASVDIPEANIHNLTSTATRNVTVQST